jgi:hypothetical protein
MLNTTKKDSIRSSSQVDSPGLNSDLDAVYSNFQRQHTLSSLPINEETDQNFRNLSLNEEITDQNNH